MTLWIFRILFTAGFVYVLNLASREGVSTNVAGDLAPALYLALTVALGMAAGLCWAPILGEMVSEPLTATFTDGSEVRENRLLLGGIQKLAGRGYRRLALAGCIFEGLNRPWAPTAFILGLDLSPAGSVLELLFAREVMRFDNAQNCLKAARVYRNRGLTPPKHDSAEVTLMIKRDDRKESPDKPAVQVASAPKPSLTRNEGIRLFTTAKPKEAESDERPSGNLEGGS